MAGKEAAASLPGAPFACPGPLMAEPERAHIQQAVFACSVCGEEFVIPLLVEVEPGPDGEVAVKVTGSDRAVRDHECPTGRPIIPPV